MAGICRLRVAGLRRLATPRGSKRASAQLLCCLAPHARDNCERGKSGQLQHVGRRIGHLTRIVDSTGSADFRAGRPGKPGALLVAYPWTDRSAPGPSFIDGRCEVLGAIAIPVSADCTIFGCKIDECKAQAALCVDFPCSVNTAGPPQTALLIPGKRTPWEELLHTQPHTASRRVPLAVRYELRKFLAGCERWSGAASIRR